MLTKSIELSEKDKRILLALETNARQSAAQIAKTASVSKEVVNYRIKKYLASNIITKFFIIPNFEKMGFTTYRIYLQFLATTPQIEEEIISYVRDFMPCQWIGMCDGRWDVIARIAARDILEFNNFMGSFREKYGKYIRQQEVTVQLQHTWWPSTFGLTKEPLEKKPAHEIPKLMKTVSCDEKDLLIISELMDDARISTVAIAGKVGLSPDAVNYRIKKLIRQGAITQIKSYFNREKLGYQHNQIFVRFFQEPKGIEKFISFLNNFPSCFFISSMVGAWDMQFGIDARNSTEFHELFGKIKETFPHVIRDYESLIVYKEYAPNPFRLLLKLKTQNRKIL